MATPTLSASPNPVPVGGSSTVTVSFSLVAGNTYELKLLKDGVEQGAGTVTFAAEATPAVALGATNQGWELRTSGGTLTALGNNKFSLSA